jgi:hypothetical protein
MTNKYTFEINVSKPDKYGNCYAYFTVTNNENGKSKSYQTGNTIDGFSERVLAKEIGNCNIVMRDKIMIRKFNHASKPLKFMDISLDLTKNAETIKKELE